MVTIEFLYIERERTLGGRIFLFPEMDERTCGCMHGESLNWSELHRK